jgi:hypothetical protein
MKPRYHRRMHMKIPVIFTIGSRVGEGRVLDLTVPGCLIESPMSVKQGDYLHLKLLLPGLTSPFVVALAAVRWTDGSQFGVEFIKMAEKAQRQLTHVMARHLSTPTGTQEGTRHQFSEPGGQNWHLRTYSLAKGRKGAA